MLQKPKTGAQIALGRKSGSAAILKRITGLGKLAAYVGVPADEAGRTGALTKLAGNATGKRAKKLRDLVLKGAGAVNNAELLFIHTKGSPLRKIPARPVLQPAVEADGNKQAIAAELARDLAERAQPVVVLVVDDVGLADQLDEIAIRCARLPVLDPRSEDDILGYDSHGVPHDPSSPSL